MNDEEPPKKKKDRNPPKAAVDKPLRKWSKELYFALLTFFREGGILHHAPQQVGCSARSARRAYYGPSAEDEGWDEPIVDVLKREELLAGIPEALIPPSLKIPATAVVTPSSTLTLERIIQHQQMAQTTEYELARIANIEHLRREKELVFQMRDDAATGLKMAATLAPAMQVLARRVHDMIMADEELSIHAALDIMTKGAKLMDTGLRCGEIAIKMTRLDRGESTENVAVRGTLEMNVTEAMEILKGVPGELEALGLPAHEPPRTPQAGLAGTPQAGLAGTPQAGLVGNNAVDASFEIVLPDPQQANKKEES